MSTPSTSGVAPLRCTALVAALLGFAAACAARGPAGRSFTTDACPLGPGPRYGVIATAPGNSAADSAYLGSVARAVVSYWDPTGRRSKLEPQTPQMALAAVRAAARQPIVTIEPWRPRLRDTAELGFTIHRGGGVDGVRLTRRSGDAVFDRSLVEAVAEAVRWRDAGRVASDTLPRDLPGEEGESVAITLRFGSLDTSLTAGGAVVPFARQSRPAISVIGNRSPTYPERLRDQRVEGDVLMGFRITTDGRVEDGSIRVLKSSDPALTRAVLDVLPGYRFTPAMVDCQLVPQWVQLPFAFLLGRRPVGSPDSTEL